jgi:hypothetical protein
MVWQLEHTKTVDVSCHVDSVRSAFWNQLDTDLGTFRGVVAAATVENARRGGGGDGSDGGGCIIGNHGISTADRPVSLLDWASMNPAVFRDGDDDDAAHALAAMRTQTTWTAYRWTVNPMQAKGISGGKELRGGLVFREGLVWNGDRRVLVWTSSNVVGNRIADIVQRIIFSPIPGRSAETRCDITLQVRGRSAVAKFLLSSRLVRGKIARTYDEYMDMGEFVDAVQEYEDARTVTADEL